MFRKSGLALLTALTALAALLALPSSPATAAAFPEGPDVSSHQHPSYTRIDWQRVAASGKQFTFVKATEGTTYTNPYFAADWQDSGNAGLIHGAYHYARPYTDMSTAVSQAQVFASTIGDQSVPGTLPPVLDLEESNNLTVSQLQQWTTTFLTNLETLTGRTPMIYTYPYFWTHQMGNSTAYARYPLWIANYGVSAPTTLTWGSWTFWQYTSSGSVDGITTTGSTDVNRFNGTTQQLQDLALGPPPPPDPNASPAPYPTPPPSPSPSPSPTASPGATPTASASPTVNPTVSPSPSPTPTPTPTPSPTPSPSPSTSSGWGPSTSTPQGQVQGAPRNSRYTAVTPTRFVDTRNGLGLPKGQATHAVTITIPSSVPADAPGVVLNVSVVDPTHSGFLRASAAGQQPTTTAINYLTSQSVTGLVVTPMSSQRQVTLTPYTSTTDLVVDLIGYYTAATGNGGHWNPVAPQRFVDTRVSKGAPGGAHTGDIPITVPSTVPADATGVVLDVSVVNPTGDGYLRLTPTGTTARTTALNFSKGQSVTGLAITGTNSRQVTVSIAGSPAQLVVDLVGYYDAGSSTGSTYVAVAPQRFVDTRGGLGGTGPGRGPLTVTLPTTVPTTATGVVIDVSVVSPGGSGYLRLSAPGDTPTTTSLNFLPGQNTTGLAISAIRNGQITLTVFGGMVQLVADLVGYHTG